MNSLPFLVVGNVKSKERKVLQQAVQGDTRYGLSIENGGWYEPCYVVRYLGEFVAFSNDIEYILKENNSTNGILFRQKRAVRN